MSSKKMAGALAAAAEAAQLVEAARAAEVARLGPLLVRSGLADLGLDDAVLLGAFRDLAERFRASPPEPVAKAPRKKRQSVAPKPDFADADA